MRLLRAGGVLDLAFLTWATTRQYAAARDRGYTGHANG